MGTNYYLRKTKCPRCGRGEDDLHIGKLSSGWVFLLHIHKPSPRNLKEWIEMFIQPGNTIVDEYEHLISAGEMLDIICTPIEDEREPKRHVGLEFARGGISYDVTENDFC